LINTPNAAFADPFVLMAEDWTPKTTGDTNRRPTEPGG
jgi:hypothetical protein